MKYSQAKFAQYLVQVGYQVAFLHYSLPVDHLIRVMRHITQQVIRIAAVANLVVGALGACLEPRPSRGLTLQHLKVNICICTCGPLIFTYHY